MKTSEDNRAEARGLGGGIVTLLAIYAIVWSVLRIAAVVLQ